MINIAMTYTFKQNSVNSLKAGIEKINLRYDVGA